MPSLYGCRPMCPACQLIFETLSLVDQPRRRQLSVELCNSVILCQRPGMATQRRYYAFARARRLCTVVHRTTPHPRLSLGYPSMPL